VALTGYGQNEDKTRARDAGFDVHLTKPVDLAALVTVLREASVRGPSRQPL
jgi:CheY-like chemotaxis protein